MKKVSRKCTKGFAKKKTDIKPEVIILTKALLSENSGDIAYTLQLILSAESSIADTLTKLICEKTENSQGEPLCLVGYPVLLQKNSLGNTAWEKAKKVGGYVPGVVIEHNPFRSYVKVEYVSNKEHIAIKEVTEVYKGYLHIHKVIDK